jgi:hypothetical protein
MLAPQHVAHLHDRHAEFLSADADGDEIAHAALRPAGDSLVPAFCV